jgi:ribosome maturation factor RimP
MDVRSEVVELATPLADELGFEVVDVEYAPVGRRWVVRVFLDRPGGVTLGDCARFSRRLGDVMEMNQTLPHAYVIEVSSPGIERRLRTGEHFRRFLGARARVDSHEAVDGRRHVEGRIESATDAEVTLTLDEGGTWTVPLAAVKGARLVIDPWSAARGAGQPDAGRGRREHKPKRARRGR